MAYATIRIYDITTLISDIWKIKISGRILTNSRLVVTGKGEKGVDWAVVREIL